RRRAREAWRLPARFPRRHHSSLDPRRDGRARSARRVPQAAARESAHHQRVFRRRAYAFADFTHLPTRCKFVALMPQWDFLNFLADHGKSYPSFHLRMRAEAVDLIEEDGRVAGVRANTQNGALEVRADLTVGCDGRHSTVCARAGFKADDLGAP